MAEASATAEGELARTPLAHLLVYALDQQLTGALFLTPPEGAEHVVRLSRGVPVKVRPGDGHALLGAMLVEAGAVDAETLDAALATALTTRALLGDVLLLAGRVERDALEKIAESQFVRRMVRLFTLPGETGYRYFDAHEALAEHGAGPACVDPLTLLWAGLRAHGEASAMMESTLARLGEAPLRLHPATTVDRFGLDAEEEQVCEILRECPLTMAELAEASSPEAARRLAYALTITRQLDFGAGSMPLGAEPGLDGARASAASTAVARMALRSTVHRAGAAAPDLPGDGERRVLSPLKPRVADGAVDAIGAAGATDAAEGARQSPPESGVVAIAPDAPTLPETRAEARADDEETPLPGGDHPGAPASDPGLEAPAPEVATGAPAR